MEELTGSFMILLLLTYLLPSSVWSSLIEDVSQVNTALIMGAPKEGWRWC